MFAIVKKSVHIAAPPSSLSHTAYLARPVRLPVALLRIQSILLTRTSHPNGKHFRVFGRV